MTSNGTPGNVRELLEKAAVEVVRLRAENRSLIARRTEPIAIIGIGCRFPGGCDDPDKTWRFLARGGDAIREIPDERWPAAATSAGLRGARWAGLLDGDPAGFDAEFFGIAPREVMQLDPQQRLLLELSWEALEHAGCPPDRLGGSATGVFVGMSNLDYQDLVKAQPVDRLDAYAATGSLHSTAAGRIAYTLDFRGPCLTVDTACSSSLVAVHLACRALRDGECELALAGGVHLVLSPTTMQLVAQTQALAPDGRCKTFDARADGFVRSEGSGLVVLKRLADAERDGDRILALIRGSAVNQDGHSTGLTAPNVLAQQALLRQALASAGVAADQIGLIEAHGTGTSLGDPIEVEALCAVVGGRRADGAPCWLGSVKANFGHLEAAAGVTGLIKVVLALQHEMVPPQIHLKTLNPRIHIEDSAFTIPTEPTPWPRGARRRIAGVSSFGISGTNAHVIVEEPAAPSAGEAARADQPAMVLPLSARSPEALRDLAAAWVGALGGDAGSPCPADLAHTAAVRRAHHAHRLAVVGRTGGELAGALTRFLERAEGSTAADRRPLLVFAFPGQGSQWPGMGRRLLDTEPVFAGAIDACASAMRPHVDWSLIDELRDPTRSRQGEIDVVQPVLWAVSVALAALWRHWGVEPDAVVGHSMGEVAAACHAGILDLEDGARIICQRSRLMRRLSGRGAMALVELDLAGATAALASRQARLSIAASNGPRSTVVSGETTALESLLAELEAAGVFARRVKVDVASHSREVDGILDELRELLAGLRPRAARLALWSTVLGRRADGPELGADYWARNLRDPVRFAEAVAAVVADEDATFVEISPHPILLPSIGECLSAAGRRGELLPSMERDGDDALVVRRTLAALYSAGHPVTWDRLYAGARPPVAAPAYPWQRTRFWVDPADRDDGLRRAWSSGAESSRHPLLGPPCAPANRPTTEFFETEVSVSRLAWLADHRVGGRIVMPATGYIEMARAAAAQLGLGDDAWLEELALEQMLEIGADDRRILQIAVDRADPSRAGVEVFSRPAGERDGWVRHATAALVTVAGEQANVGLDDLDGAASRCPEVVDPAAQRERMARLGIDYGPRFHGVVELRAGAGESFGRVQATGSSDDAAYHAHPAALDACLQVAAAALAGPSTALVPVGIERLRLRGRLPGDVRCHVRLRGGGAIGRVLADLRLEGGDGAEVGVIAGLALQPIELGADAAPAWAYEIAWRSAPLEPRSEPAAPRRFLLLSDGGGLGEHLAAELEALGQPHLVRRVGPGAEAAKLLTEATAAFGRPPDVIVHLLSLDARATAALDAAALAEEVDRGLRSAHALVQAIEQAGLRDAPRLVLVTRGAEPSASAGTAAAVAQAPMWGFGRSLMHEHPELRTTLVDLDPTGEAIGPLVGELLDDGPEDQVAFRAGDRLVARLARARAEEEAAAPAGQRPFRLEIARPGALDGLTLRGHRRRPPGPGEVEIEVETAGLNFLDVLLALGALPADDGRRPDERRDDEVGPPLGRECAGRIAAIGPGVSGLAPGQPVLAIADRCVGTHVLADHRLVVARPLDLSAADAVTLPLPFLTAYRALVEVARVEPGERVLIHAAAGGVGLAAIQLARRAGAEIIATAGSDEKRAYLRGLGIGHVFSSRDPGFAAGVRAATGGEGVDVVLNSLAGRFIEASLDLLRPDGRFVEIGKRDYLAGRPIDLGPLLRRLSYTLVDLRGEMRDRPARVGALLARVVDLCRAGEIAPLPRRDVPIGAVGDGFHAMARGEHIGKLVVTLDQAARAPVRPPRVASVRDGAVRADRTFLVTGGLGGVGLRLARWLVDRGARTLVLIGRSADPTAPPPEVEALRAAGATVEILRADAAIAGDVARVFRAIAGLPPLGGVIHAAGFLDDGAAARQPYERIARVLAPKVLGAWNLHEAVGDQELDFFVLCSSAAALLGSPGQAGYGAGNAFLDALAHYRRARGLAALAIDWGAWTEVGLAAREAGRGDRLVAHGIDGMSPDESAAAFGAVLAEGPAQRAIMRLRPRQWHELHLATSRSRFLAELLAEGDAPAASGAAGEVRARLEALPAEERDAALRDHVRREIAHVLRCDPARIGDAAPLQQAGLDSLMAMELRNRLETGLGLALTVTLIWRHPTVADLARHAAQAMGLAPADGAAPKVEAAAPITAAATPTTAAAGPGQPAPTAATPGQPAPTGVDLASADKIARLVRTLKKLSTGDASS